MRKSQVIAVELIAFMLILLFAYTGWSKFTHQASFYTTLRQSPLTFHWASVLTWLIPLAEFALVLLLLFPRVRKLGLALSTLLMSGFTVYVGYMLLYVKDLPCSCGGVISSMSWEAHFLFNGAMSLAAGFGWLLTANKTLFPRKASVAT